MEFPYSSPFRRSLLAAAVAAGLALSMGQAAAQNNDSRKQATETKRAEKDARKSWEQSHRASKIIGAEVRNAQYQKVGKVKDLVLSDPSSGTISHFVVAVGGVAGIGDKLFLVPFNEVQHTSDKDYFVLSASSDLSKGFDDNNWPTGTAAQQGGADRTASTPPASSSAATTPSASPGTSAASPAPTRSPDTSAASTSSSASPNASAASTTPSTASDAAAASTTPGTSLDSGATPATASPPPN